MTVGLAVDSQVLQKVKTDERKIREMSHNFHVRTNRKRKGRSSSKRERKATVTLAIVLGEYHDTAKFNSVISNNIVGCPAIMFITESKKISNDQEVIQSDPTSCPQNQKGNN